jgi:hypothetical protein
MTTTTRATAESLQPLILAGDEAGILAALEPLIRHTARKWTGDAAALAGLTLDDLLQVGRLAMIKHQPGKDSLIGGWISAGCVTQEASVARIVSSAAHRDCQRAVASGRGMTPRTAQCRSWLRRSGHSTVDAALADPSRPASYSAYRIAAALRWVPVGTLPEDGTEIPAPPANEDAAAWTLINRLLAISHMTRAEAKPLLVAIGLVPGSADVASVRRTIARILAPWSGGKTDQHSLAVAREAAYRELVLGQGEDVPCQLALMLGA